MWDGEQDDISSLVKAGQAEAHCGIFQGIVPCGENLGEGYVLVFGGGWG